VADLSAHDYECAKTDFDTGIPYALLDAWSRFPDFQTRLRNAIVQRQALDLLRKNKIQLQIAILLYYLKKPVARSEIPGGLSY
jgi:hypothetical protein